MRDSKGYDYGVTGESANIMPEGKLTGNLPEDETKWQDRGNDGVRGSAAMLLLGVFFESTGIGRSYGVLLLGTRHRAQGARKVVKFVETVKAV